ncbi:MAG: phage head closure protein [Rhizobiaceae bacterium]
MQLKFLDPGQLRTQLTLEQPVETQDGQGGLTLTWNTLATVWALVEPMAGRGAVFAERADVLSTHRIWLRHRGDVNRGMRLGNNGRIYRIDTVEDADGSRRYLVIKATEVFA